MPEKLTEQEKLEKRALKPVNKTAFRALVHVANALFKKKYGVSPKAYGKGLNGAGGS